MSELVPLEVFVSPGGLTIIVKVDDNDPYRLSYRDIELLNRQLILSGKFPEIQSLYRLGGRMVSVRARGNLRELAAKVQRWVTIWKPIEARIVIGAMGSEGGRRTRALGVAPLVSVDAETFNQLIRDLIEEVSNTRVSVEVGVKSTDHCVLIITDPVGHRADIEGACWAVGIITNQMLSVRRYHADQDIVARVIAALTRT